MSQLDQIIPPEIHNDEFYFLIVELSSREALDHVLEIGSSAGGGSTEAFATGLARNPGSPTLHCLEVSRARFDQLRRRYQHLGFVECRNASSVPVDAFPSVEDVMAFYESTPTTLNQYPLGEVLRWRQQDIDYVLDAGVPQDGIAAIKRDHALEAFDLVLIDGSEFLGDAELDEVMGSRWILLDDVNAYKCHGAYQRLAADADYELVRENWHVRNGYAVFHRIDDRDEDAVSDR